VAQITRCTSGAEVMGKISSLGLPPNRRPEGLGGRAACRIQHQHHKLTSELGHVSPGRFKKHPILRDQSSECMSAFVTT
jgi:hypothetical protein